MCVAYEFACARNHDLGTQRICMCVLPFPQYICSQLKQLMHLIFELNSNVRFISMYVARKIFNVKVGLSVLFSFPQYIYKPIETAHAFNF